MTEPWIHYACLQLSEFPTSFFFPADLNFVSIKPPSQCLHFALGTAWRDWAQENLPPRGYTHKYKLLNADKLRILVIDAKFLDALRANAKDDESADHDFIDFVRSVAHVERYDGSGWGEMDWGAISSFGYDGVLVRRDDIMASFQCGSPWFTFASARESDELVLWSNAQLAEQKMDWRKEYYLRSATKLKGGK